MAMNIIVPQLGESVVEGVIGKWHFKEGDRIERDQTILDIETDKINLDIPCPKTGILAKIFVQEGTTVEVEQVIGLLLDEGEEYDEAKHGVTAKEAPAEKPAAPKPAPAAPAPAADPEPAHAAAAAPSTAPTPSPAPAASAQPASDGGGRNRLSPAVRRLIEQHNLNIEEIPGTGEDGRIRKIDVEKFMEDPSYRRTPGAATAAAPAAASPAHAEERMPRPAGIAAGTAAFPEERIALTPIRKTIAHAMQRSKNTAAHTLDVGELDCTNLVKFRNAWKEKFAEEHGVNLTYMPFFIKASVAALKKFPFVNASITDDEVIVKHYYNIGFAVDTEAGLVVPNIKHADQKSIVEIQLEMNALAEKARDRKLTMEDITGGTFTLTNAGGFGVLLSSPVINYPEVAILGIHAIEKRPVVKNGEIVIRDMMYLAVQFDHRLVDGVYAIKFRNEIHRLLTEPELLFMHI